MCAGKETEGQAGGRAWSQNRRRPYALQLQHEMETTGEGARYSRLTCMVLKEGTFSLCPSSSIPFSTHALCARPSVYGTDILVTSSNTTENWKFKEKRLQNLLLNRGTIEYALLSQIFPSFFHNPISFKHSTLELTVRRRKSRAILQCPAVHSLPSLLPPLVSESHFYSNDYLLHE